jgi:hypothetical protein
MTFSDPEFISLTTIQVGRRQHLQRLSPHGLHWLTVNEGLDTAENLTIPENTMLVTMEVTSLM